MREAKKRQKEMSKGKLIDVDNMKNVYENWQSNRQDHEYRLSQKASKKLLLSTRKDSAQRRELDESITAS